MAALTVVLAWSLGQALRRHGALAGWVMIASALLSIACGIFVGVMALDRYV